MVSKAPANLMSAVVLPAHNGKAALALAREAAKTIKKKGAADLTPEQGTPAPLPEHEHELGALPPGEQAGVVADTAQVTEGAVAPESSEGKPWHEASESMASGASQYGLQLAQAQTTRAMIRCTSSRRGSSSPRRRLPASR